MDNIEGITNPTIPIRNQNSIKRAQSKTRKNRLSKKLENRKSANYTLSNEKISDTSDAELQQLILRSRGLVGYSVCNLLFEI